MDATSILFVAVIVLLGGPLAYGADWLGRRLGKKRLSIFGMRPRHTAAFLTVAAGIFIPLLTVILMLVVSSGVRQWVLRGSQAIGENQRLVKENSNLQSQIEQRTDLLNDQSRQLRANQSKAEAIGRKLLRVQKQSLAAERSATAKLTAVNQQLRSRQAFLLAREAEVRKLSAEVSRTTSEIATKTHELTAKQRELATADKNLRDTQLVYNRLRTDYTILDQERTSLLKSKDSLERQVNELTPQVSDLRTQIRDLKQQRDTAVEQLSSLTRDLENARHQYADLENLSAELIGASLSEPMIYRKEDEIVRLPVEAGLSEDGARHAVESLLSLARMQASKAGAQASEDVNVVGFVAVRGQNPMSPLEVQAALIKALTNRPNPAVLVAFTPFNAFRTQPVRLQVALKSNPVVYRQGQSIADTRIDGRKDQDAIIQDLRIFLSERVTQKAIADQMIPRQGQDSPLGEVTFRQLFDVVQAIRTEARPVKVAVIAKADIRAADPLQIEFKVGR